MGRRVRDRLQRGGLVEFHRSARPTRQAEQTQVAVVLRHAAAGQQTGLGPFQVNTAILRSRRIQTRARVRTN